MLWGCQELHTDFDRPGQGVRHCEEYRCTDWHERYQMRSHSHQTAPGASHRHGGPVSPQRVWAATPNTNRGTNADIDSPRGHPLG